MVAAIETGKPSDYNDYYTDTYDQDENDYWDEYYPEYDEEYYDEDDYWASSINLPSFIWSNTDHN